ncbi:MAG: Transcriptional regulator [Caproiciproducens sp.]|nr:Transcriptional regulator [Caproiciproducens sp.]
MDFKQLESFVSVINFGSFSKAGENLFLTQPTISGHIRSLEKEFGVRLIVRTTKAVYPSEAGKKLFAYAQDILRLCNDAVSAVSVPEKKISGVISIAASTVPSQYILPEIMTAFRRQYPDLSFYLTNCDSRGVAEKVASGEASVGIAGAKMDIKRCTYRGFMEDELIIITPNTKKFKNMLDNAPKVEEIMKEPLIIRERGSGTRAEMESFLLRNGIDSTKLNIVAEMEDPEAIKRSVSQGLGISVISQKAAADFSDLGYILSFPNMAMPMKRKLYLVNRKDGPQLPEAQAFINFVMSNYNSMNS